MSRIVKARTRSVCPICKHMIAAGALVMKDYEIGSWGHVDCVKHKITGLDGGEPPPTVDTSP